MLYLVILVGWLGFNAYSLTTTIVLLLATRFLSKARFSIISYKA